MATPFVSNVTVTSWLSFAGTTPLVASSVSQGILLAQLCVPSSEKARSLKVNPISPNGVQLVIPASKKSFGSIKFADDNCGVPWYQLQRFPSDTDAISGKNVSQ